jgi:hypothetical protein
MVRQEDDIVDAELIGQQTKNIKPTMNQKIFSANRASAKALRRNKAPSREREAMVAGGERKW